MLVDFDHSPPLREPGSELFVFGQTFSQAVQALGDFVAGAERQRRRSLIHFDSGNDSANRKQLGERNAVTCALTQRFVKENHTADEAFDAVGREKEFAISSTVLFRGLNMDRSETFLDRRAAFVGRQHALLL